MPADVVVNRKSRKAKSSCGLCERNAVRLEQTQIQKLPGFVLNSMTFFSCENESSIMTIKTHTHRWFWEKTHSSFSVVCIIDTTNGFRHFFFFTLIVTSYLL